MDTKTVQFGDYLKHHGLDHDKWIAEFAKHNIASEDNILSIKGSESVTTIIEIFESLASEDEIIILKKILGVTTESPVRNKPNIESELESVGLETTYWSKIFSDELGIISAEALEFVGSESYPILERSVRHTWEKKSLRQLLKLDKNETSLNDQRKKQKEMIEKRHEKARVLLQQLMEYRDEGKNRNDEQVVQIESEIREMLQIPPKSWIKKDSSMDDLIKHVEASDKMICSVIQSKSEISDSMILRSASGGLALTGILLTRKIEDQVQDRNFLLQVPQNVTLLGPAHYQDDWIKEFSSKTQEDSYIKSVNKLGYSVSASTSAGFWGFQFEAKAGYAGKHTVDETNESHKHSVYYSSVKHSSMPLASFYFNDSDLLLSVDALSALRLIETKITTYGQENAEVKQACEEFFKRFGSHANRGPLHFGGVYWLKCCSSGINESELSVVKQLQSEVVYAHASFTYSSIGVSGGVDLAQIKAKYTNNCSETTISNTQLEIVKNGGPPEMSTLSDWKTGLVASNSTWSLIDRGPMLVPVWDIISKNHCIELNQVSALVDVLHKSWESIAELNIQVSSLIPSADVPQVLEGIVKLNKASNISQEELQGYMEFLIGVKQDLIKRTMNPKAWSSLYLIQPPIQQFLKTVLDAQNATPPPPEAAYVKQLMQQLVRESDLKFDFPYKQDFLQWLYNEKNQQQQKTSVYQNCHDVISFCTYLDLIVEKLKELQKKDSSQGIATRFCDSETSAAVATAIKSLLSSLRTSSLCEFIMIATLIYPFIYSYGQDESINLKPLSLGDIEFLSRALTMQRKEFYKIPSSESPLRMQAYLFYYVIDTYCNDRDVVVSEVQLKKHIQFMQQVLGDELQPQLKETLPLYVTENTDWGKVLADLSFYRSNASKKQMIRQSSHSLEHVLKGVSISTMQISEESQIDVRASILASDSTDLRRFFNALNLSKYYPKKLTLQLALCIRKDTLGADCKCSDPGNLLFFVLRKIMAYDYRCRSELCPVISEEDIHSDDSDSSDSDDSTSGDSFTSALSYIHIDAHPLDCLLAVLLCADDFLRQDLMARLATCQIAIPLLFPDPFTDKLTLPLWALKTIVKEWKCNLTQPETVHEGPIINYNAPIVSFVRISKQARSKSNTLNSVISNSNHEHFFHRDMEGGFRTQLLGDGVVDMCWYLPAGKQGDIFPDAIVFLNLHGDARKHQQQLNFLSQISFLTFAFVSEEDFIDNNVEEDELQLLTSEAVLNTLSESHSGLVLLTHKLNKGGKLEALQKRLSKNVWVIKMEDKNDDKIKKRIRERINKTITEMWKQEATAMQAIDSDKCIKLAHISGIIIDEDNEDFKEGRRLAHSLETLLTSHNDPSLSAKQAMLPLQGKNLWIKWASLDKEEHRQVNRGGEKLDRYGLKKFNEKKQVRRMQLHHVQNLTPLMESFIVSILTTLECPTVRNYFLQCVKLILNNLSREEITQLQTRYKDMRSKLLQLQTKREVNQEAVRECKLEIEELHEQMINASLGLEHLLRELGQIYEAIQELNVSGAEQFSRLPQAAASLLIDGYPLEIMDGDAAHVPSKWIKAVLQEVGVMLGDASVFILSVLGLQSTGKSTLMNTAFGLQFNVSAGRCTRGAFMQLLPINEELREEVKSDYILIIDTEGLRAPELDSQKTQTHDNELATFVIGLADVTLINIFGESPGDMDDILQTAVHAFIRMANVKLNPSCQFVHQNVGAVVASGKGDMGRSRFKDKLDAMTCAAAKEENCEGKYEYFSEVIRFDDRKDVHHFPGLWRGDPPMAPVNTGYSEMAQNLVAHIIKLIKKQDLVSRNQVTTFETRVDKLWNALLNESFVFSFKNTMERTVYSSLEAEYFNWSWSFKRQMLEWQKTAENKLKSTKKRDELTTLQRNLLRDLPDFVRKVHDEIMIELVRYFEESKQREMLAQWQADAQNRLKRLAQDEENSGKDLCIQLTAAQIARTEVGDLNKAYSDRILLKLKDVFVEKEAEIKQRITEKMKTLAPGDDHEAEKIEEEIKEQELHDTFNSLWRVWIEEMAQTLPRHHDNTDVERDAQKALTEVFSSYRTSITNKLKAKNLHQRGKENISIKPAYIALKRKSKYTVVQKFHEVKDLVIGKSVPSDRHTKQAEHITKDIVGKLHQFLEDKRNENYRDIHFTELLRLILKAVDDHTAAEECEVTLTHEYRIVLSLAACGCALKQFEHKVEATKKENDPIAYLEQELKKPLYDMFRSKYDHTSQDKTTASIFCGIFKQKIEKQVESSLGPVIVTDIVGSNPYWKAKPALIKKILIELGEDVQQKRCLEDYYVYLKDPERSLKQWIKRFTFEHCEQKCVDDQTRLVFLARCHLEALVTFISKCMQEVERKYRQSAGIVELNVWLKDLCTSLEGQLQLDFDVFDTLTKEVEALNDIKSFTEEVQAGLSKLCVELIGKVELYTTLDLENWQNGAHKILYDQLRGCPDCCPFCGEQCELLMKDHQVQHSIKFHRPNCLKGYRYACTSVLASEICTTLVGTETSFYNNDTKGQYFPYKNYGKLYPKWEIVTDNSVEASVYWKWFLGNYGREIAEFYGAETNDIFDKWKMHFEWKHAKEAIENTN
jgi:hypothetical protein